MYKAHAHTHTITYIYHAHRYTHQKKYIIVKTIEKETGIIFVHDFFV